MLPPYCFLTRIIFCAVELIPVQFRFLVSHYVDDAQFCSIALFTLYLNFAALQLHRRFRNAAPSLRKLESILNRSISVQLSVIVWEVLWVDFGSN